MNLVSTYRRNWKRTNVQLVSLACGLALATVAIVGANEVLRYKDSVVIISPAALQPQFGTAADAAYAAQSLGTQAAVSPGDALGIGQPGEGAQSVAAPQFGTAADAAYSAQSLGTQAAGSRGDALGIGQPGERTRSVTAPQFGTAADAVYAMEGEIQLP